MDKSRIRAEIQMKRDALTPFEIKQCSDQITTKVLGLKEYLDSDHVFVYMEIKNEVSTKAIIEDALKKKKKVSAPKIITDGKMDFIRMHSFSDLTNGTFGILEPKNDCPISIAKGEKVFMLIPGLAYDASRNRIGFGKGYYDRYLERLNERNVLVTKVAIAYDFQIVNDIKAEPYDQLPDIIVTPTTMIVG